MKPRLLLAVLLIAGIVVLAGCSKSGSPVEPANYDNTASATMEAHYLSGLFTITCDPEKGSVEIVSIRDAALHLNALKFLEPPPNVLLTIEGTPKIQGGILDVDLGISNPYLGFPQFAGFDVSGVIFTHGSYTGFDDPGIVMAGDGDTHLLNADGYIRWWNPAEFPHGNTIFGYIDGMLGTPADSADFNSTINGYKYYADGLAPDDPVWTMDLAKRGSFKAGSKNVRHYTIDLSGGIIFNYAVDASWKFPSGPPFIVPDSFPPGANRPEAFYVSVTVLENTLWFEDITYHSGGDLKLSIDVWDHFNAGLNQVSAESLAGLPILTAPSPVGGGVGYSTYELDFNGGTLIQGGEAELLISVRSEADGYGGILPGTPQCSYFTQTFNIVPGNPQFVGWARTWGGSGGDYCYGTDIIVPDDVYVSGYYQYNVDFDPGPGVDEWQSNGSYDSFISKFDRNGSFIWGRGWGGQNTDYAFGMAADQLGNIVVTGAFPKTVDFDTGPEVEEYTSNGSYDVYVTKFDSDGNHQWARTWGSNGGDEGFDVVVDSLGNVYVTGHFWETVDFDPGPGVDEHTGNIWEDVFLSKFDPNGEFLWARTWGSGEEWRPDGAYGLAVDSSDNIYVTGKFYATADFDPGPDTFELTSHGHYDIYLSKFTPDGDFTWAKSWGGNGGGIYFPGDAGLDVVIDQSDNIYVGGYFVGSGDFDPGPEVDTLSAGGDWDACLSKFNSDGDYQWARSWGNGMADTAEAIAVDESGNVTVTGYFTGVADLHPGPEVELHEAVGTLDMYVTKLDGNGGLIWIRTFGGEDFDSGQGLAVDDEENVYAAGYFNGTIDFNPGPSVDEHTADGKWDALLMKLQPDGYW